MKVKIRKKPFEEIQISILSKDKYEEVKNVDDFMVINKQVEQIMSSVKSYVDFKLIIDLDI